MGKRNNATMSDGHLEAQENDGFDFADSKTSKRLRTTSDAPSPPHHNTSAALTLLSLKKKAVCFQPPSPFSMTKSEKTSSIEDDEPTIVSKSTSCASSVCSASVTTADADRDDNRSLARLSAPLPHQIHCTISPLRKPMLCHLYTTPCATKVVLPPWQTTIAVPLLGPKSMTNGSFCRPMPPPPVLPKFLVHSSYPPFATPTASRSQAAAVALGEDL